VVQTDPHQNLRQLPRVDDMAAALQPHFPNLPQSTLIGAARNALHLFRQQILQNDAPYHEPVDTLVLQQQVLDAARRALQQAQTPWPPRVLNATGIVVHTGLGRSLLSPDAVEAAHLAAADACALEVDIASGERGQRDASIVRLLQQITGCEDATVCNNGAGATLLALSTLAAGREVICARGELVEIGGGFRMPDVMRQSGATLQEVGCTNKVRIADYASAISASTGALLKVHTSNYRVVGFTEEVGLAELVQLGAEHDVPIMEDLGSGVLVDLAPWGLTGEPTVQERVATGADVVVFSGDKLLGGPQAGILCGRKATIERIRKHPLMRALRCDKMTLAALEATLRHYQNQDDNYAAARRDIPTLQAITTPSEEVRARALKLKRLLQGVPASIKVLAAQAQAGAGSLPTQFLPSFAVVLEPQQLRIDELARRLRSGSPSLWGRVQENALWLDCRTLRDGDLRLCARCIRAAMALDNTG
jgi:L-seryl-tRNA(Ser) seleniumtransferase